jgi:hypothetical protein
MRRLICYVRDCTIQTLITRCIPVCAGHWHCKVTLPFSETYVRNINASELGSVSFKDMRIPVKPESDVIIAVRHIFIAVGNTKTSAYDKCN